MESAVEGLEDASNYPDLITEMLARGWSDEDVIGLMGANLMRVMDEVDAVAESLAGESASSDIFEDRKDLPAPYVGWGENLPDAVKEYLADKEKKEANLI